MQYEQTNGIAIAGRPIGAGHGCYVIAEAGVNHNGQLPLALELVDAAADAGADAVKFQTFEAESLVTLDAPKCEYQARATGAGESQFEMLKKLELSHTAHQAVVDRCRQRRIQFLSTPFDESSADFLEGLGVAAFKIPSGELTNLPLIDHIAGKGAPLILSTGMANLSEVEQAVQVVERTGNRQFVLLHCVSNYPAAADEVNLRAMATLRAAFQVPVGYSDHTLGLEIGWASVALGACVIEKHFTLDRSLPGPDHQASLDPEQLQHFVRGIHDIELAMGTGRKSATAAEKGTAAVARRSLVAARDIAAGTRITADLIAFRRPGTGLPPGMKEQLLHRTAREDIPAGTVLRLGMVA
ncbi:MAG: N-acetylneuraminate synthase [Planctomycetes bacterium]|nr:N-acetylneuraminate synthase [Planctomycetota bacterium]